MTTTVIEGRLEYLGWSRPWSVVRDGRVVADLASPFWAVAQRLKDKPTAMPAAPDSFGLKADAASEYDLDFDAIGAGIIISKRNGFGFTNVLAYCEAILCNLNGREIIASIEEESFSVFANPQAPEVPALKRKREGGNLIPIGDEFIRSRCGAGTADACIFITVGSGGFECAKFAQSLTRTLLDRKATGTMRATRIGNCRVDGWEE